MPAVERERGRSGQDAVVYHLFIATVWIVDTGVASHIPALTSKGSVTP